MTMKTDAAVAEARRVLSSPETNQKLDCLARAIIALAEAVNDIDFEVTRKR